MRWHSFGHAGLIAASLVVAWLTPTIADDDNDAPLRLEQIDGLPAVRLSVEEQRYTGLRTQALESTRHRPELPAFAQVVDLQPLLQRRAEFESASAEQAVAEAELEASEQTFERLRMLHDEDANVSAREFQEARAQWRADKARLAAIEREQRSLHARTVHTWGRTLTDWALGGDAAVFNRLLERETVLTLLVLSAGQTLPRDLETVYVQHNGDRVAAREAKLISPAPEAGGAAQGETYFTYTQAEGLRTGMRLAAWVPSGEPATRGVALPESSIIWYAGRPWAYVKLEETLFARRPIDDYQKSADGWFVEDGFEPGERIVTRGAQMLLSEEFRWQIPEEDDD